MKEQVTLQVKGMTCDHCGSTVRNGLLELPGVLHATVDWRAGRASVAYDPTQVQPIELLAAPVFVFEIGSGFARHRYEASLPDEKERPWAGCC